MGKEAEVEDSLAGKDSIHGAAAWRRRKGWEQEGGRLVGKVKSRGGVDWSGGGGIIFCKDSEQLSQAYTVTHQATARSGDYVRRQSRHAHAKGVRAMQTSLTSLTFPCSSLVFNLSLLLSRLFLLAS